MSPTHSPNDYSEVLGEILDRLTRLEQHIRGGSDPESSILVRVSHVEQDVRQAKKSIGRVVWAGITALIGTAVLSVWERIVH